VAVGEFVAISNLFHLPLSEEAAFVQLQQLQRDTQSVTLTAEHDWWSYI
jgi:hypothetical protein